MSSDGPGPIRRLLLGLIQRISSRRAASIASQPPSTSPQSQCYCDPTLFPNPGIVVLNYKQQPVPGAQVYVDGKYVGTTSTDPGKVGRIWPAEFTPCVAHQVKAVACDGTSAIATLGYWCYPSQEATTDQGASKMLGQGTVNNSIVVLTGQCGGSTSTPTTTTSTPAATPTTTTTNQPPYVAPPSSQPTSSPSTGCPTGLANDFVLQGPHGNPTDSNIMLGFMVVAPSPFISGTYTVDWGDGTSSTGTWSAGAEYNISHTLPGVGTYTITLTINTSGCNALTKGWTVNVLTYQQAIAAGYQPASLTDTPGKQVSVPGICSCQCSDLPSMLNWNNQLINEIQGYIDKYYPILVSEEGQQLTASSIVAVKGPGIPNYGIMTYEDYCAATGKCLGYTTDWQPTWDGLYTADEWKSALENEISQLQSQNSEIESAMRTQCGYAI